VNAYMWHAACVVPAPTLACAQHHISVGCNVLRHLRQHVIQLEVARHGAAQVQQRLVLAPTLHMHHAGPIFRHQAVLHAAEGGPAAAAGAAAGTGCAPAVLPPHPLVPVHGVSPPHLVVPALLPSIGGRSLIGMDHGFKLTNRCVPHS